MATSTLVIVTPLLALTLLAENWPQWRGPLGTGVSPETGLPTKWSSDENIAWKAPLRGLGVSSPVVWGDRVFVTFQVGASASSRVSRPSLRPTAEAEAAPDVANAWKPRQARMRAEPTSHGFGIMKAPGPS